MTRLTFVAQKKKGKKMSTTPVAGIPSAKRVNVHAQMMLNVVIEGNAVYRAFNRAEAARWVHENVPGAAPIKVLESRIKTGFLRGGKVAEVGNGARVVKTATVAKWRGREYHCASWRETMAARKRRLSWAYKEGGVKTTTTWRR